MPLLKFASLTFTKKQEKGKSTTEDLRLGRSIAVGEIPS
jgi:hypothetical protein